MRHRYYPRQALVAALVMAVVLLFWADRFSDLSMKLMSRYGVGDGKKVQPACYYECRTTTQK